MWFDEATKWRVFLGQNIRGEVRIRIRPAGGVVPPGSKLERFWVAAAAYDDRMNIYTNNCRIFCARMEREVARLNDQDCHKGDAPGHAGHGRGNLPEPLFHSFQLSAEIANQARQLNCSVFFFSHLSHPSPSPRPSHSRFARIPHHLLYDTPRCWL